MFFFLPLDWISHSFSCDHGPFLVTFFFLPYLGLPPWRPHQYFYNLLCRLLTRPVASFCYWIFILSGSKGTCILFHRRVPFPPTSHNPSYPLCPRSRPPSSSSFSSNITPFYWFFLGRTRTSTSSPKHFSDVEYLAVCSWSITYAFDERRLFNSFHSFFYPSARHTGNWFLCAISNSLFLSPRATPPSFVGLLTG